jgi:tetratricopeptide (TPR) repeat protein
MPAFGLSLLILASLAMAPAVSLAQATEGLVPFRDRIEQAYNARDSQAIEAVVTELKLAGKASRQEDTATYYAAFARLRQSALPGIPKDRARDYLEQCIDELEPLVKRRRDHAQSRALYASCLGASVTYHVLRAATRGMASAREMSAALRTAPDNPWVVLQDAVSDFLTPAMFGGNKERALGKLYRAEQLFVASRPTGSGGPVFGEGETWLYIGRVRLALGQKAEAREALERARSLAPASADVRDEITKL